ncbi:MAG: AAA+ family ATPase, partial [Synechococcales cyanobacterium T60_A2020_003]|nr:AAA+ family ATPase [Synechococcales cyanobacterium T60_A2020_003]
LGLKAATGINPNISVQSLLVKPDIAQQQFDAEAAQATTMTSGGSTTTVDGGTSGGGLSTDGDGTAGGDGDASNGTGDSQTTVLRRFYGNVDIDAMRINRDTPAIANEVIQHLTALNGAKVKITLEIEAEIPDGVPDDVVRTVTENCRTLKFKSQSFEQE